MAKFKTLGFFWLWCALAWGTGFTSVAETFELRVMTFNLWHGGDAGKQPLSQSAEVIRKAGADLVGLQETSGLAAGTSRPDNAAKVASMLGFHYYDQGSGCGILSRFPIVGYSEARRGARIELPSKEKIWLFNVHFAHAPYQPYQLLGIPYEGGRFLKTSAEAVTAARNARGHQVRDLLNDIRDSAADASTVLVTGDFNEPSHLDWTVAAAHAGLCPIAVPWPSAKALADAGFQDAYRTKFPNPVEHPGLTWTPITAEDDPGDRHDRIDFVFFRGRQAEVRDARVIGERPRRADLVVLPYPSDHRAVAVSVLLKSASQ
jgi:exodeoxyribonuclease III